MKSIKIFIAFLITICLLGFSTVFAADATASLTADKTTAEPGDTIVVKLNANCSTGLSYVGTSIVYNTEMLTLQNTTIDSNWINYGTDKLELFVNSAEKITSANVCTLTFKVNDNTEAGLVKISTSAVEIMDTENNEYTKSGLESSVTIAGKENNEEQEPTTVTLSSISVEKQPTKTEYTAGDKFVKEGMKVVAKYSDGTTKEVTDYTYTPAGELAESNKKITIKYTEGNVTKEAEVTIKVNAKASKITPSESEKQPAQEDNSNKEDTTTSKTTIPQTGTAEHMIVAGITGCVIVSVVFLIKGKKLGI